MILGRRNAGAIVPQPPQEPSWEQFNNEDSQNGTNVQPAPPISGGESSAGIDSGTTSGDGGDTDGQGGWSAQGSGTSGETGPAPSPQPEIPTQPTPPPPSSEPENGDASAPVGQGLPQFTPIVFFIPVVGAVVTAEASAYLAFLLATVGLAWMLAHPEEVHRLLRENVPGISWIEDNLDAIIGRFYSDSTPDTEQPRYVPSPKHDKSIPSRGQDGTAMDLTDEQAQHVLDNSIRSGKKRYGYKDGKVYVFQPDNAGGYHGYPELGKNLPPRIGKGLRDAGIIDDKTMKRLPNQREFPK